MVTTLMMMMMVSIIIQYLVLLIKNEVYNSKSKIEILLRKLQTVSTLRTEFILKSNKVIQQKMLF